MHQVLAIEDARTDALRSGRDIGRRTLLVVYRREGADITVINADVGVTVRITIQRDIEQDIVYLAFSTRALKRGSVRKSVRAGEDVVLDFDGRGVLLGLEVMNASRVLGLRASEIQVDTLVGVREAAALAGVRPSNFVRDYAGRTDFPRPVVELASGRIWNRADVEDYVRTRKRRLRAS